jgi:hypothetical protein
MIFIKTLSKGKGSFNKYVDRILPFNDPLRPPLHPLHGHFCMDKFFLTPSPPSHHVNVGIECPCTVLYFYDAGTIDSSIVLYSIQLPTLNQNLLIGQVLKKENQ